ncbi:serine/threonine-protein kinase GL21140 [Harmonia axyridis]|uniref:serine/threonine-protein kinase GL21140 n=1 Tax=Harmonia axyridis TaxID=115357 RepID=UPI001E275812|nr:serine/threonine-protein kinase GL21140 [Harmonia axyridis]
MSRNNLDGSRSFSSNSCNSTASEFEIVEKIGNGIEELSVSKNTKTSSSATKSQKAKRIRFYHNGNKFFPGVVVPVNSDRYRSFDSLTTELTNLLTRNVTLPNGVRHIYSMDGKKIASIDELEEGKEYICAGKGEVFKKAEYSKTDTLRSNKRKSANKQQSNTSLPKVVPPNCIRPRIVTLVRNGIKPRKVLRLLLNKRNSSSMDQVLGALTEVANLDSGAVRKVFTLAGQSVTDLSQFFSEEDVFFVCGNERCTQDNFELDFEESKAIQQYKKTPGLKNGNGPKPKMPRKSLNRTYVSEESILEKLNENINSCLPSQLKKKYTVGRSIGDGNFAVVRLCKDNSDNKEYALKIIDKSKCKGKEDMIENEVKILRKISHPNIMSLISDQDTKNLLFLVCEYVQGGDLFDAIALAQKFSEEQAALLVNHLVLALAYLHSLNIVHRDVKPENLLVEFENNRIRTLKLADFGLACEVAKPLYTVCGTPTYVAPEILAESGYGLKIDVWAAGVILYILLCGYPPFVSQDNDQEKLFDCILSGQYDFPDEYWGEVSELAKELIQNMLQLAPEIRFSAEDVLDHPWLQLSQEPPYMQPDNLFNSILFFHKMP